MGADDLFTRDHWEKVADKLYLGGKKWWNKHRDQFVDMGKDEARAIFEALRKGKRLEAQYEVVARMDEATWIAYRDGTTETLRGIAARRAAVLRALEELGWFAARTVGTAALSVL